jgi:hypothetical protein
MFLASRRPAQTSSDLRAGVWLFEFADPESLGQPAFGGSNAD